MKKIAFLLSLGAAVGVSGVASAADLAVPVPPMPGPVIQGFPPVVVQLGPTTSYSTIVCSNFTKLPDGSWRAIAPAQFGLGFTQHINPPLIPIKVGAFIYNNVDLWSQLEAQCEVALVRARY